MTHKTTIKLRFTANDCCFLPEHSTHPAEKQRERRGNITDHGPQSRKKERKKDALNLISLYFNVTF